uniref:hypothetical protein n=1 Tax=Streptomyces sp. PR69 TaxID=2984950 RepID=UPI003A5C6229
DDTKEKLGKAANVLGDISTATGYLAAGASLIPGGQVAAGILGGVSLVTGAASAVLNGMAYGFTSKEFIGSTLGVGLGVVGMRFNKVIDGASGLAQSAGTQAKKFVNDVGSSVYSTVTSWFD